MRTRFIVEFTDVWMSCKKRLKDSEMIARIFLEESELLILTFKIQVEIEFDGEKKKVIKKGS